MAMILQASLPESGRTDAFEVDLHTDTKAQLGNAIAYLVDCGFTITCCNDEAYQGGAVSHGIKTPGEISDFLAPRDY